MRAAIAAAALSSMLGGHKPELNAPDGAEAVFVLAGQLRFHTR